MPWTCQPGSANQSTVASMPVKVLIFQLSARPGTRKQEIGMDQNGYVKLQSLPGSQLNLNVMGIFTESSLNSMKFPQKNARTLDFTLTSPAWAERTLHPTGHWNPPGRSASNVLMPMTSTFYPCKSHYRYPKCRPISAGIHQALPSYSRTNNVMEKATTKWSYLKY